MKIIDLTISPAGEVEVKTSGFPGASCREGSKFLEDALGRASGEKLTAEFYQNQISQENRVRS